jgi:replicative DNA helicase
MNDETLDSGLTTQDAQLPPHDEAAEWWLVACMVHKPELIGAIRTEIFYVETARRVLLKMQGIWLEKKECLKSYETFEHEICRGLAAYDLEPLNKAMNGLPSAENWSYWLGVVEDCWKARKVLGVKAEMTGVSDRLQRGDALGLDAVSKKIVELNTDSAGTAGGKSLKELAPELIGSLEKSHMLQGRLEGISTGFSNLDRATSGLQDCRFYIFAGRPGEGKSSFLGGLAHAATAAGHPVLYISLEMPAQELGLRMVASISRVVTGKFARGTATEEDFFKVSQSIVELKKLPLNILDSSPPLSEILKQCHQACERGTRLIIVDYIQRVHIPNFRGNRNDLITEVSGAFKDLAMLRKIPVVAAAQLGRAVTREEREPNLADLRDSGSLEQDADFVGLLHSVDPYSSKMLVAKNRSGETGTISFTFKREFTRFECPL